MTALMQRIQASRATTRASKLSSLSLAEFIPAVSPGFVTPKHLAPLLERIEAFREKPLRLVVATPPRHGKTETWLHAIAWVLTRYPKLTNAYISHGMDIAREKSRTARRLTVEAGARLAPDAGSLERWFTTSGGGLHAAGTNGQITGFGMSGLFVIDDPVKNRRQAESSAEREHHRTFFRDVVYTRLEPGASCIVNMTRWHPDDISGWLVKEFGWEYLRLPAIDDDGNALWPERWPVSELEKIRAQVGEYTWASLYQGTPRPRGGAVFRDATLYDERPAAMRIAIGLDLAYTAKTHADYSVAVVLGQVGNHRDTAKWYVLEVVRAQVEAPKFIATLKELRTRYAGASMHWYAGGTEKGTLDFLKGAGVPVIAKAPIGDKFVRSQGVAAAWNAGRVVVPSDGGHWADELIAEVCGFTGVKDSHDDQVDALASAFDALPGSAGFFGSGTGIGSDADRLANVM